MSRQTTAAADMCGGLWGWGARRGGERERQEDGKMGEREAGKEGEGVRE